MRITRLGPLFAFSLLASLTTVQSQRSSSTAVPRDAQAVTIIANSIAAMAQAAPSDSTATGTINLVAGSLNDSGTITVLTRGTNQTAETLQMSEVGNLETIYSQGSASQLNNSTSTTLQPELAVTSQCPDFPLPFLTGAVDNPDFGFKYIGTETVDGLSAYHVQFWDTFASTPQFQNLASFTTRDIWIAVASALPVRLSYNWRAAGGSAPSIPMQVDYSNYQSFGGTLYPLTIKKSKNGTVWQTITIQNVQFNTGLTDADFPVAAQ